MRRNELTVLQWEGKWPDLKPVENSWDIAKNRVAERQHSISEALRGTIKEVWTK